jgi:VanZ family protein
MRDHVLETDLVQVTGRPLCGMPIRTLLAERYPRHVVRNARAWRFALPVCWLALAAVTHYPQVRIPGEDTDKVVHFVAFALLAVLFWMFFAAGKRALAPWFVAAAAVVLVAYASIDEYTQRFVGRDSNWSDWVANLAGIGFALLGLELHRRLRRSRATETA